MTTRGERVHITLFGVRNAGKSSLMNALAGRTLCIVSDRPGTTTDPVTKAMELGELGPVALTDTAGLDDEGDLGSSRVERSLERLAWTDVALLVAPLDRPPSVAEEQTLARLSSSGATLVLAVTFCDRGEDAARSKWLERLNAGRLVVNGMAIPKPVVSARVNAPGGSGISELLAALSSLGSGDAPLMRERPPLDGLVEPGSSVLLVTPIDAAAPKGRLILPQTEVLRDALDCGCAVTVCRETELARAYGALREPPGIVITDSQAFALVSAVLPLGQRLTSFSILYARKKGELERFESGMRWLMDSAGRSGGRGGPGPIRLLSIEACTHNRTHDDIATVKIPALLSERTGRPVDLSVARELRDAPVAPGAYDLAALCGGCMATRARMMHQLDALAAAGIPVVNFGLFLAWAHGAFPRALDALYPVRA